MARPSSQIVERCWTLLGARRGALWLARRVWPVSGEPAQVAFDAARVLAREEARGDVIGFLHTHPQGPAAMSQRDVRTMRSWSASFGKPLLCIIDVNGSLLGWQFDDDRSAGVPLATVEAFPRGYVAAATAVGSDHSNKRA